MSCQRINAAVGFVAQRELTAMDYDYRDPNPQAPSGGLSDMSDPLSIASSIITFIDTAQKLKETFVKQRLNELEDGILRELSDLELFCRNRHPALNSTAALELKTAIDELQTTRESIQCKVEMHIVTRSNRLLSSVTSSAKGWWQHNAIETDVVYLEKCLRSIRLRLLHLDRLEHVEDLVSYMLLPNIRTNAHTLPVLQVSAAVDGHAKSWTLDSIHPRQDFEAPLPGPVNTAAIYFRTMLLRTVEGTQIICTALGSVM
ncbi:hypothetical protein BDN71DRAFT_1435965 [Pleurotus eryngii]|uniref:Uncharacterized protein n=1 Tax=Pleurotus eryngii TaxID=5323 RepID=A0A9P6D1D4_PLEER|nr:hypothetical protein BDN71DRAFT_1435965 [Pleurotus eryngii]